MTLYDKLESETLALLAATKEAADRLSHRDVLAIRLGTVQVKDVGPEATWHVHPNYPSTYYWSEPDIGPVKVTGCTFDADTARRMGCPADLLPPVQEFAIGGVITGYDANDNTYTVVGRTGWVSAAEVRSMMVAGVLS